ncbi:MAG TPA: LysM domain-containing protein, partial [Thermotogaceae bacterium]|nr:LysM domain-containing protein [Thermotogaceae bacterium]
DLFDNDESKDKIIIVGISNDEDFDVFSVLDKLDDRVDLVIFESDLSGVFDINGKKVLALSGNDLLSLKVNGNNIEYSFEPLFNPSISPFEPKINEMSNWLNRELAVFAYKPRDYGFNGLNPVNTVAEFLTNIFEGSSVHSIPLIAFEDQNTNQKIRIKDVIKLLNHGTLFESTISGKDVEKILNDLIEEGTTFEIGNVNYIAQIDETNKTIKWLKYRGHEISKRSSFELITNVPTLDDLKFKVATKKLWNVLKQKRTSMKYVKNWYIINKPFEKEFRYYVVDWGDNIGTLALVFNKDAKLLMDMNGLKKPRELKAGDVLIIPMF